MQKLLKFEGEAMVQKYVETTQHNNTYILSVSAVREPQDIGNGDIVYETMFYVLISTPETCAAADILVGCAGNMYNSWRNK